MAKEACIWCWRIVEAPKGYDPKESVLACSVKCGKAEAWFQNTNTDEQIGMRNYEEHGVNPNHRGKGHG